MHKPFSTGYYDLAKPVKDCAKQCASLLTGWPMTFCLGWRTKLSKPDGLSL
jgi:hypothetical protein